MHRLSTFPRGEKVRFTFDGQTLEGFTHESLAAAILASGHTALSRSLRFHRPRAMFCSSGECGWCAVEVDGVPSVPACAVLCRHGVAVRSQNSWPSAEHDLFALLDLASPLLPYTFFHHRFLRPKFLRQFYLRVLRFFTGMGRLRPATPDITPRPKERVSVQTDVAVIGGGIAGLNGARATAENGAHVVLLDNQPVRPEISSLRSTNLMYWPLSTCLGLYAPGTMGVLTPDKLVTLTARRIILATGARDALPIFVNNELPGVISARLVERLLLEEGVAPGSRAVVWGAPALSERLIAVMLDAGIQVARRLSEGETIVAARGAGRAQAAVVRDAAGQAHRIACDLIVIGALQPRTELLAGVGGARRWDESNGGLIPVRDRLMESTAPGVYVVGEAAGPADAARCAAEGRLAGLTAARRNGLEFEAEIEQLATEVERMPRESGFAFPATSIGGAGHVCFCEDVREREIRGEMQQGYTMLEMVKRRTGVVTGPCQGKFCLANVLRVAGQTSGIPTARPPAGPVRLGELVAAE